MKVQINGREHQLPADATLLHALEALNIPADRQGSAIAVKATVVPRSAWSTHTLEAGDAIEIVTAAQGG